MKSTIEIFAEITKSNPEQSVHNEVDNAKSEYVWDWEEEFESLDAAYEEQGRGEAESQVLRDLIYGAGGEGLSIDDYCELQDKLADHYYLSTI